MEQTNQNSDIPSPPLNLPSHISPPSHQLSGHVFGKGKNKLGLLKDGKTSHLLKPFMDERGPREYDFYRKVWSSSEFKSLQSFIPRFYGLVTIDRTNCLELEDCLDGMINPSNMDIKIGLITYGPTASYEKIKSETAKNQCSAALGFKICGMRIYNPESDDCVVIDKTITHQLVPSTTGDMLDLFLGAQHLKASERLQLIDAFLCKLRNLRDWFVVENINKLNFYSSSLLFIYSINPNVKVRLKMIDFAHVYPSNTQQILDVNYLFGLDKLIEYFAFFRNNTLSKSL